PFSWLFILDKWHRVHSFAWKATTLKRPSIRVASGESPCPGMAEQGEPPEHRPEVGPLDRSSPDGSTAAGTAEDLPHPAEVPPFLLGHEPLHPAAALRPRLPPLGPAPPRRPPPPRV